MSPWDGLVIDADYVKAEAQAGRMGSVPLRSGRTRSRFPSAAKTKWITGVPGPEFLRTLKPSKTAEAELALHREDWLARGVLATGRRSSRGTRLRSRFDTESGSGPDMFSSRQLLVHAYFVDEFQKLVPEVRAAHPDDQGKADAILGLLGLMHGKALNYNSLLFDVACRQSSHPGRCSTLTNLAFKWTYVEFEASRDLFGWVLGDQLVPGHSEGCTGFCYRGIGVYADV